MSWAEDRASSVLLIAGMFLAVALVMDLIEGWSKP